MLGYKIDVLKELKEAGYTSSRMRQEKIFGERTIQIMRHQEMVGIIAIERLCKLLNKQPGDLICFIDDDEELNTKTEV